MITRLEDQFLDEVMGIWLHTNIAAHGFIAKAHWESLYETVKALLPASDVFIYRQGGKINGFIGITDSVYIAGLFVDEKYQAQGIGQKLLNHCQQLYSRLELDVFVRNAGAVRFYLRNGFYLAETRLNPEFQQEEQHMIWINDGANSLQERDAQ